MKALEEISNFVFELTIFLFASIFFLLKIEKLTLDEKIDYIILYVGFYCILRYFGMKFLHYDRIFGIKPYKKDDEWG